MTEEITRVIDDDLEYEFDQISHDASYLGITKTELVMIQILRELKEISRNIYNIEVGVSEK